MSSSLALRFCLNILETKLELQDVNVVKLNESQYSFQHIKSISLHSHLHQDPWNLDNVYYVNHDFEIMQVISTKESICEPRKVFKIPVRQRCSGRNSRYNVMLQFISQDVVVLTDGAGTLYLLSAIDRPSGSDWKVLFSTNECASDKPFVLMHSLMQNASIIECLLLYIEDHISVAELKETDTNLPFVTVLEWVTLISGSGNTWKRTRTRRIAACGNIDYAALEANGQALCIVSEKNFKYIFDSEKPILPEGKEQNILPKKDDSFYAWTQNNEEITIWLKFNAKTSKSDIDYKLTSSHLHIGFKTGHLLLEGSLFSTVDVEGSIWTWQDNKIEVTLSKANPGLIWQELIKGDDRCKQVLDANLISAILDQLPLLSSEDQIPSQGQQLGPFNPQQLEECDDFPVDSYKLIRIGDDNHRVTHEVSLSSHQWLFSRINLPNEYPVFCVRHDVDGLLWQPSVALDSELNANSWQCEHVATFNALGYVLASKQDKKFLSCSPQNTFVAVCDARLYLYLYFQPSAIDSDLRNRKTGKQIKAVAKQQLITLDTSNVLGLQVSNHNVFVLTEENLYIVNVES